MSARKNYDLILNSVLAICALALTATFVRREFFPPISKDAHPLIAESQPDWQRYAVSSMRIGTAAPITITEFSDFECPVCYRLYTTIEKLQRKHGKSLALVYRNYPLNNIHKYADSAARAAQCASSSGRFPEFYRYVFEHQDSLQYLEWPTVAKTVGVTDTSAFKDCMQSSSTVAQLRSDSVAARELKIPGTPLLIVNGWIFRGAPSEAVLDSVIQAELQRTEK